METIEVRSKSYVIKWVDAVERSTIHYEIKPLRKSINFTVYTYKEGENPFEHDRSTASLRLSSLNLAEAKKGTSTPSSVASSAGHISLEQKLENAHLVKYQDLGRLNGDELSKGEITVSKANIYAFVFDNTFSKTTGKKVLFSQYSDHERRDSRNSISIDNFSHSTSLQANENVSFYNNRKSSSTSSLSYRKKSTEQATSIKFDIPELQKEDDIIRVKGGKYIQGFLLKKRRKKTGKNFNKRFFTLNFKYGILNYYLNDKSKHVRGNMFIKFVGITADTKTRVIVLDSGLEIWTLKATSDEDFQTWVNAFNLIKQQGTTDNDSFMDHNLSFRTLEDRELDDTSIGDDSTRDLIRDLEILQNKLEGIKSYSASLSASLETHPSLGDRVSSSSTVATSSTTVSRKSSFWRKKRSESPTNGDMESLQVPKNGRSQSSLKLSKDLHGEIVEASNMVMQLVSQQQFKARNREQGKRGVSGNSAITTAANSVFSQEFFDANDYVNELNSGVLMINNNDSDFLASHEDLINSPVSVVSEEEEEEEEEDIEEEESIVSENLSSSDEMEDTHIENIETPQISFETDLYPLTEITSAVPRRADISPSHGSPPSILSFVRKNIGKDLSTISMPVTANEPLTMLQKYSEILEYCTILHPLMDSDLNNGERILKVAVFATTYLSSLRCKERNNRKPFNPLLGETFELVREDLGMRLICEKVCHRPQVFAMFADSEHWTFQYSPSPAQKFWSKNAEVINKGIAKLTFKKTGEVYQWIQPTTLLKNIIAGEKYTEPSSSMTISSSTGQKAVVEFKQGGMFSGRSEDLTIKAMDSNNKTLPSEVTGTWTEKLTLKLNGSSPQTVWNCGSLVSNFNKKYGFTEFAASLNEMTSIEEGKLAPTDSRFRPDLKEYEIGNIEELELLKLKLEQDQRDRRNKGEDFIPQFFYKVNEERYDIKKGSENYWERRKTGNWDGLIKLW